MDRATRYGTYVGVVFLLDLDNTLIDNDAARDRLAEATRAVLGDELAAAYWDVYEAVRLDLGYVDTLETLRRFHARHDHPSVGDLDRAILDFPYATVRYLETLGTLAVLRRLGTPVVLSDGDPIFQPLKVARSGVDAAVGGNVLVFTHKDEHLDDVARLFPADHYVAVDDKTAILGRIKEAWNERVSTVHVLQGKYSDDRYDGPAPDATIGSIGGLVDLVGTAERLEVFTRRRRRV